MGRTLKVLLLMLLLILAACPFAGWWFVQRPIPSLEGFGEISGLSKAVLVRFDARAVPYIEAESDEDMYAAQGYLLARERMFQMELLRRAAEGRFAEIFGLGSLPNDRLMRTIGFERLAQEELEYLDAPAKSALDAYCRGVNAYLDEYADRLPLEFTLLSFKPRPWRPVDSLAVLKYLSYELDESWTLDEFRWRVTNKLGDKLAAQIFKDDWAYSSWSPEAKNNVAAPLSSRLPSSIQLPSGLQKSLANLDASGLRKPDRSWGSTAWVLSPLFSKSGGAMLASDKHGGFTSPNDWYLCSLSSTTSHVAGATIPGVPGIVLGRNNFIAWGGSSLKADVQDLYVEHFDSQFGFKYKVANQEKDATVTSESIPVRFGKDVEHKITTTRHGPVLLRDKESAVALSWTGFETRKPVLNSLLQLNRAADWSQFLSSIESYSASPQLFVFADSKGNLGCHAAGIIPVRGAQADGTTMSEGWTNKGDWVSSCRFSDLPGSFLPAGSVSSSKLSGDFCIAGGQKLLSKTGSNNLLLGHQWSPPYRANRLSLSLPRSKANPKMDLLDFNALQADEFNMLSRLVADSLKDAAEKTKTIDICQLRTLELMRSWDGRLKVNSAAATAYEAYIHTLARRIIEPKLGRELSNEYFERWPLWITLVEHCLRGKAPEFLPPDERTYDTFLITTFAKANTRLKLYFKSDTVALWDWQKIHLTRFKHLLSNKIPFLSAFFDSTEFGLPGDENCLNACDVNASSMSGAFRSTNGPTVRLLVDMSDADKLYAGIALGQSGHFMSPFNHDQLPSWLHVDPSPIAFSTAQLDKQTRTRLYLSSRSSR